MTHLDSVSEEQIPVAPLPPVNAIVETTVSGDGLSAYINIVPPQNGGNPPSLADLQASLAAAKITVGVNQPLLENIAQMPTYEKNFQVASGSPAQDGTDGSYQLLFDTSTERKPVQRPDGTVDFYNLNLVKNVQAGQTLCSISLPTDGIDGLTVRGEKLSAKKGKAVPNLAGKNTKLDENGTAIFASIKGHVAFINQRIEVNDTLIIKEDISFSTGNIKTPSNVIVWGTVSSGFSVESEGSIQIGKVVNGAILAATGNIVLKGGINSSNVRCEGDLATRFIESCEIFTKGNVKADYILNSNIKCGKSIQTTGSISKIVGGSCMAGEDIRTRIIGSSSGIRTYLEIGTDPSMIIRQQELTKSIPEWKRQLQSLSSLIELFKQYEAANRLTEDKQQMYTNALYSHQSYSEALEKGQKELDEITESIRQRGYGKINCTGTAHAETTIKIGIHRITLNQPLTYRSFSYSEDGIVEGIAR